MTIYIEDPKEYTKELLELISEFNKVEDPRSTHKDQFTSSIHKQ